MTDCMHILDAYAQGRQALIVSGRTLHDLDLDESGQIRPLRHILCQEAHRRHGMIPAVMSLAAGVEVVRSILPPDDEERATRSLEESPGAAYQGPHGRALDLLQRLRRRILDGEVPPMLLFLEFAEDFAPRPEQGQTDLTLQLGQMLWYLASDYQMRRHPLLMVLSADPTRLDGRLAEVFHPVELPQPDREAKKPFIQALRDSELRKNASYGEGVDDELVANLSAHLPNRGLEAVFLASSRTSRPVVLDDLIERKRADVMRLSEGTLEALDTERTLDIALVGRNAAWAAHWLTFWGEKLRLGDPEMPANLLLAGAPSTGKTDLAMLVANITGVPAYRLLSPKGGLVGLTERLVRLQMNVFKSFAPSYGLIDEISESLPMERGGSNLDAGASAAVTAEMLTALSDNSRKGKNLLVGTTNLVDRIGSAMLDRWVVIPVLQPLPEDFPDIVAALARRLIRGCGIDADQVRAPAALFAEKGVTPRGIQSLITLRLGRFEDPVALLSDAAECAAHASSRSRLGAEWADLHALRACGDRALFPWHADTASYPFPPHLRQVVAADGTLLLDALDTRIAELKPHVNV